MVLQAIYVTRHGFRTNWSGEEPKLHLSGRLPPDTPLSEHGEAQSRELAAYLEGTHPPIEAIYSSPFYRCVQTVAPAAESISRRRGRPVKIRPEPGLGEWYGADRQDDPKPATAELLHSFVPAVDPEYRPIRTPDPRGETIEQLHARTADVVARLIKTLDKEESDGSPSSVLLCTHAATFVAICRALAGESGPSAPSEPDFVPWTACITKFERRDAGIGGRWECTVNGDCSFLSHGKERGWRFSGKESFTGEIKAHGIDAGTGLGVVLTADEG